MQCMLSSPYKRRRKAGVLVQPTRTATSLHGVRGRGAAAAALHRGDGGEADRGDVAAYAGHGREPRVRGAHARGPGVEGPWLEVLRKAAESVEMSTRMAASTPYAAGPAGSRWRWMRIGGWPSARWRWAHVPTRGACWSTRARAPARTARWEKLSAIHCTA